MLEVVADNSQAANSADCREQVEIAMREMIERLASSGLPLAEIALCLADAAEEYVISLAQARRSH